LEVNHLDETVKMYQEKIFVKDKLKGDYI